MKQHDFMDDIIFMNNMMMLEDMEREARERKQREEEEREQDRIRRIEEWHKGIAESLHDRGIKWPVSISDFEYFCYDNDINPNDSDLDFDKINRYLKEAEDDRDDYYRPW